MRLVVPLLLIVSVALPATAHAKAARPRPVKAAKVARAAQPATHGSTLAGAVYVVPATAGMMGIAVAGLAGSGSNSDRQSAGGTVPAPDRNPPTAVTRPPLSPE